jgi:ABC-type transporter MlaC component
MLLSKLANEGAIKFLRTVTIKNAYFADQMLKHLVNERFRNGLPDELNPYYIHISGNYILGEEVKASVKDPSSGDINEQTYGCFSTVYDDTGRSMPVHNRLLYTSFDEMMYVTSLDTRETIPFTRINLHGDPDKPEIAAHTKTLEAYKVGGKYFKRLCGRYPNQVDLIKSIVYFAPSSKNPIEEAIDAKHLSLVSYDETLLEERERINIIDAINAFLEVVRDRWDTREYTYEDHYANVMWSVIWSLLPLVIIVGRYENIRTPHVHSSHLWDYLTSNGLESFKGYLSPDQEWFLYKNIRYLRDRSGQHRILNILIDNILSEYNLSIEAKHVALSKAEILNTTSDANISASEQCKYCARAKTCKRKTDEYKCVNFLGTTKTFKPNPEVLSETLNGARKQRVINLLMSRQGVSKEVAEHRYKMSFMWHDQAIEEISKELDRTQFVNLSGTHKELEDIIQQEFDSGLEPTISDGLIEEQRTTLQHARTSVIPTKILEIVETGKFAKYDALFSRFITDTLLNLASGPDGKSRISETFSINVGQDAIPFTFSFNEAVAALYLGMLHEHYVNTQVDEVSNAYSPLREYLTTFFADMKNDPTFDIPIPTRAIVGSTFKLAKPVTQEQLIEAYKKYKNAVSRNAINQDLIDELREVAGITDSEVAIIDVVDEYVANNKPVVTHYKMAVKENKSAKWLGYDFSIDVLGVFDSIGSKYYYYNNTDDVPIIPTYFKWSQPSERVNVPDEHIDTSAAENNSTRNNVPALDIFYTEDDGTIQFGGTPDSKNDRLHRVDEYLDVAYITRNYSDVLRLIRNKEELGKYYDTMFNLLERFAIVDTNTSSGRQHYALRAVADTCLVKGKIDFTLVGDGSNIISYEDWFSSSGQDIGISFRKLASSDDKDLMWNEFCVKLLDALLSGSTSPYANVGAEKNRYNKLRKLVTSLSSYLVTFIDTKENTDGYTEVPAIRVDEKDIVVKSTVHLHFEAVGEQLSNILAHFVDHDDTLRELLGIDAHAHLDVLCKGGEWRYRIGHDVTRDLQVETYPADPDATRTDVSEISDVSLALIAMGYSEKIYEYTKTIDHSDIVWEQVDWSTAISSEILTNYMNNKTRKLKLETATNVTIDVAQEMPEVIIK